MTIDDRLRRAGEQFRADHTEPAPVQVPAARTGRTPSRSPRRRLVAVGSTVLALVAVTAGVLVWVATSGGAPRPEVTTPAGPIDALAAFTTGTWQLTTVDPDAAPTLRPTLPFTLTVTPGASGQELHLDDGCNVTTVPVEIEPGTIRVTGQALTTAVGCERPVDPAVAARAPVFGAAAITWSVSGRDLTLSAAGVTLTFTAATSSAPTGIGGVPTFWQLVGVDDDGTIVAVTTVRSTELRFDDPAGHVALGDGCNSLGGDYALNGSTLVFSGFGTTQVACPDTVALQRAVGTVFGEGSTQAEQADNRLTLRRGNVVLTYDLVGAG